ncbi:MAG: polysaccharide deacetylase family protein [Candidatus Manganitrophus sp. SA1]|nr:polysaccharide deacetylase family protein [Candidatus Manganitrophus morganii]
MKKLSSALLLSLLTATDLLAQGLPPNFEIKPGVLFENMKFTSNWTLSGTGGHAFETSTTIFRDDLGVANTGSIKLIAAASSEAQMDRLFTTPIDMQNSGLLGLWFYVEDRTKIQGLTAFLSSAPNCSFDSHFSQGFFVTTQNGWNFFTFTRESWIDHNGESWSNPMRCLRLRVRANDDGPASVYFDVMYHGFHSKPCVIFAMDDGARTQYSEGFPIFQNFGIRGTLFVYGSNIGDPAFLTEANLHEFHDAGWEIGNHSYTHPDFTLLTQSEIENEIAQNRTWLNDRGFTEALNLLAPPYSVLNPTIEAAAAAQGIRLMRGGTNKRQPFAKGIPKRYDIYTSELDYRFSLDTAKGYIDAAVREGSCQIFTFHNIVSNPDEVGEWPTGDLQPLLQYAVDLKNAGTLNILTLGEFDRGTTATGDNAAPSDGGDSAVEKEDPPTGAGNPPMNGEDSPLPISGKKSGGGGCAIRDKPAAAVDPTLAALLIGAALFLGWKQRGMNMIGPREKR